MRGHGFIEPYDKAKTQTILISQNRVREMKMNGQVVRLVPRKKRPGRGKWFCTCGVLHPTPDGTSLICDGCGMIMPAEGL